MHTSARWLRAPRRAESLELGDRLVTGIRTFNTSCRLSSDCSPMKLTR